MNVINSFLLNIPEFLDIKFILLGQYNVFVKKHLINITRKFINLTENINKVLTTLLNVLAKISKSS